MATTRQTAEYADFERALRSDVVGQRFGSTTVQKIQVLLGEDADGETALFVDLQLANPEGPTWPLDDVLEIRRTIRSVARDKGEGLRYYVALRPQNEEPQAAEDPPDDDR